ncbi:hypothetical protein AA637_02930 [Cyanobacterium sp. HL-69]|uniref:methyltransferase domain-containing protein n=1 Tax=Cyanobacterium sp. HL-69 TaxID=2054282 RepID=UPI000CA2A10F|nr:hypothetical protein AA637_02930 [Cyanobacterium sp. HL-69]
MLETHTPKITINEISQKIKLNAQKVTSSTFNNIEIKSTELNQIQIEPINEQEFQHQVNEFEHFTKLALERSKVRNRLPNSFNKFPRLIFKPFASLLLKCLSYIFKDQREVNKNLFHTLDTLTKQDKNLLTSIKNNYTKIESIFYNNIHFTNEIKHSFNQLKDKNTANIESNNRILQKQINENFTKNQWEIEQVKLSIGQLKRENDDLIQKNVYLNKTLNQQEEIIKYLVKIINNEDTDKKLSRIENINKKINNHSLDSFYLAFENKFRGDREDIKTVLKKDYSYLIENLNINKADSLFIDVGCGRGEWLEIVQELGYQGIGVDLNQVMSQDCNDHGLNVIISDCVEYLQSLEDNSVDVVTGFHIVEHLPLEIILNLFRQCLRVLKTQGMVIFETPNPDNVLVGSRNFYNDPTHRNPIPSSTLAFMLECAGFPKVEVLNLHPIPNHSLTGDELALRFSEYFYGCQDYAVMGFLH